MPASSTNAATWSTFEVCRDALAADAFDGVGIMLGDGLACLDFDGALDATGESKPGVADVLDLFPGAWVERSVSGRGLHLFCRGSLGKAKKVEFNGWKLEVFSQDRFIRVTGDVFRVGCVADWQSALDQLAEEFGLLADDDSELTDAELNAEPDRPDRHNCVKDCKAWLDEQDEALEGNSGSDQTMRLMKGCRVRGLPYAGEATEEVLGYLNYERCVPPWDESEIRRKWRDVCRATPMRRFDGSEFDALPVVGDEKPEKPKGFDLELMNYGELMEREFNRSFLVDGLIVSGESLIIGGPKKSLKTTITIDLAISVASGEPFLGFFEVKQQSPVIVISGESGGATLQETVARIAESKGKTPAGDDFLLGLRCPKIGIYEHLEAIRNAVQRYGAAMVFVDPAYAATLTKETAGNAGNVFAMGNVLNGYGEIGAETGCVVSLVHHTSKSAFRKGTTQQYGRPELDDLTQAGFAEFARQWLLLNRRSEYRFGHHRLWAMAGGSAGQYGEYAIDVDEGRADDPLANRKWDVSVCDANEIEQQQAEAAESQKAQTRENQKARILAYVASAGHATRTRIKEECLSNGSIVRELTDELVDEGRLLLDGNQYRVPNEFNQQVGKQVKG